MSHSTRWPNTVLTAPSVGARIQRHITAIASGTQIHGSTYSVRNNPLPGRPRASNAAANSPSTVCVGTTIATKISVTSSELPNAESLSTERQLAPPTYSIGPSRSQRCRLSHTTTRIGSSKNATTPNRLGASSAYPSTVDRRGLPGSAVDTKVLKRLVTVVS